MLTQLCLRRFKKFKDTTVQFAPFTVMMGENSSGKTTVLQATNLALQSLGRLRLVYEDSSGLPKVRRKGVGLAALPGMSLADYRELYYGKISRGGTTLGAGGTDLELTDDQQDVYKLQITSLFGGSFNIKCTSTPTEIKPTAKLYKKTPLFISGFVGLRSTEERAFPVAIYDRLRSGHVSYMIRNLLLDTKIATPERFAQLCERMREDFGFYLDNVLFDQKTDLHVQAQYKNSFEAAAIQLDFNSSGSGFMQVLQILAPIYRFCPDESDIVLLDEPDAHLHPNLQTDLARTLRKIQTDLGIQIIISTHSTSIIRSAHPSEVVPISSARLCKPLGSKDDVESQIASTIDSYYLGKSVISGKLVFMEDSNTRLLERIDQILGVRALTGPNTVPVVTGRGKDDKVPFQIRDVLRAYLDTEVEIHFVRDRDGLPDSWIQKIEEHGALKSVKVHHIPLYEVESLLLKPAIFLRALAKAHPDKTLPTPDTLQQKINISLKETVELSRFRYDNCMQESIYKTALMLGLDEFRNPARASSEAASIRQAYENLASPTELLKAGMGKEALKSVMNWLNTDLQLGISQADLIECIDPADLPDGVKEMLMSLRSIQMSDDLSALPITAVPETDDEDEPGAQLSFKPLTGAPVWEG